MTGVKLEVCVDTLASLVAAKNGGADRVELCSALNDGGLTPSAGFMKTAATSGIEAHAMIRPRNGSFCYSAPEVEIMCDDIAQVRQSGLAGVVFGVANDNFELDVKTLAILADKSGSLEKTLHRVIDMTPDPLKAVDQAIELGMTRILTSGGEKDAKRGIPTIAKMIERAAGRIEIMPGSGIHPANVEEILNRTNARSVHASCANWLKSSTGRLESMGFAHQMGVRETTLSTVEQLRSCIDEFANEVQNV